ncbi:MAG: hypothetical protein M1826_002921 [Phylliscum demangeonii]|nr:MAG: hypothetical protein M1826_002921 [Phylliscum demangeonii]
MASAARAAGSKVAQAAGQAASAVEGRGGGHLRKGARRDPELYVLAAVMSTVLGLAGWHFGRKPTAASSELSVGMAKNTMPWDSDAKDKKDPYKYQYHPGGDQTKAPKKAPSALHSVIVPNVTLPKVWDSVGLAPARLGER